MDITLLIALAAVTLLILLSIGLFFNTRNTPKIKPPAQNRAQRPNDGVPRRAQIARNRGMHMRGAGGRRQADSEDEEEPVERTPDLPDEKMGVKKRAKLEAKAEKKAQREAEEQRRSEKKKRDQQAEEERQKLDEKRQLEEKRIEEEQRKLKEEKEKQEYEEYLKMKEAFSVEAEGFDEGESEDSQNLLQEFVSYIKKNKVVVIEDLAAQFKLKTQAAIDRIQDLQKDDILTGVIDDRGKFIYVSREEMEAVAKFIKQRGRVSISELAENSNHLINLTAQVSA
uniref:DDRGK domain-containing protein 1 n=1 Tax=Photinus pyralis TaxID=7054 RepID=A0A1Y1LWD1_PHOPY